MGAIADRKKKRDPFAPPELQAPPKRKVSGLRRVQDVIAEDRARRGRGEGGVVYTNIGTPESQFGYRVPGEEPQAFSESEGFAPSTEEPSPEQYYYEEQKKERQELLEKREEIIKRHQTLVRQGHKLERGVLDEALKRAGVAKIPPSPKPPEPEKKSTNIENFVADAIAEAERIGKPLTPGQRNKARLEFKRAQAREIEINRRAGREVDAETAEAIKFNERFGARLAEIKTEVGLREAKGEISPKDKKATARKRMTTTLASLAQNYINLDSANAIVNVDKPTFVNILAAARSSLPGQFVGDLVGTDEQSMRNTISNAKPLLVQMIRQTTDMSARAMDSNKELQFYLQAVTNEKIDIQSSMAAIVRLDELFGDGEIASILREKVSNEIMKRVTDQGDILRGLDLSQGDIATDTEDEALIRKWAPKATP